MDATSLDKIGPDVAELPPRTLLRVILLGCLLCAILLASVWLFGTETGRNLRNVRQLFALTRIRGRDAAIGTLLGGLPVVAGWVAIGARPAVLVDWRFWTVIIGTNVVLLAPLAMRYFARRRGAEPQADV